MDDLTFGILMIFIIYTVARILNYSSHTKAMDELKRKEDERLRRVASLYGREYKDYPSTDEEL